MSISETRHITLTQRLKSNADLVVARWKEFWFAPEDPVTLGIIRVLTGAMLAYNLLVWGLDLQAFFASDGLQPLSAVRQFYGEDLIFSFLFYVPDDWLAVVHWTCFSIAILMSAGVCSRLTTILGYLITVSYSQRVPVANFGLDQILGLLCLYLAIGPSGAALSLDSVWRRRRKGGLGASQSSVVRLPSCRMTLRLIQIHLCIIYFWAGFAKLKGDSWWTGEAMWQVLANQEYQTTDLTWLAWIPWAPYLIAHVTVAWEVFFCVLIWNKTLRPYMLVIGTGMHFGIGAFLGMWTFGLVMTYAYFAFSNPLAWRKRLHWIAPQIFASPVVLSSNGTDKPPSVVNEEGTSVTGVANFPNGSELLLISANPEDRLILRRYFHRHDIPCKAAIDAETAFRIVSKAQPAAVVLYGSGFKPRYLETLIADLTDSLDVPVLVVVSATQLDSMPDATKSRVQHLLHPVSPRQIREALNDLLFETGCLEFESNSGIELEPQLEPQPDQEQKTVPSE